MTGRGWAAIGLLILSNLFMTLAWYGHLKAQPAGRLSLLGWLSVIVGSWGIAFFEYLLQVPANRLGFRGTGGPFSLVTLKILQEAISILVFVGVVRVLFAGEKIELRHWIAFLLILIAVWLSWSDRAS
ncbi:MAG: DMT family protein [Bacteroidia bacterium]|nr:DMT family protein [Bacteroidia bacterium]MCX7763954.1 DMT family protein [Bacteroidia bacterium]MDW8057155.1 DMT family protein [Bacteroidia bacterium]